MGVRLNTHAHYAQTVKCKISDAKIRQYAKEPTVKRLKDERFSLYYVYKKDRSKGSWKYFSYSEGKQHSVVYAHFPETPTKVALQLAKEKRDDDTPLIRKNFLPDVNDVLEWHITRQEELSKLEDNRLSAIRSMFNVHLYAFFDGVAVSEVSHRVIDEYFFLPFLMQGYSLNYAKGLFQLLKVAFSTAHKMEKLHTNPLSDIQWKDFHNRPIPPKPPKLMPINILDTIQAIRHSKPIPKALCTLMLYHGTRIGETRMAEWRHIDFRAKQWVIPAENTKTKRAIVYPLTDSMVEFLSSYKQWLLDNNYKGKFVFPLSKRDNFPTHRAKACKLVRLVSKGSWSAHDLRKLARTVWADLGVDYFVAESLLNHAKDKLDVVYIHSLVELQKKEALIQYHEWLNNCWRTFPAPDLQSSLDLK
ncbi:site-specific integrase [Vibrio sp. 03-59-1]|uniref:tyrosine-type recombinase/integrase n=1 Tax=Vibrio sp. 03-59-1 TaxID=2607607 RepID=UPI0014937971|nr:site-specific integrase [Vibrio sp. 03-59-1]NOH85547.1 site-specific integrase [Vibrio sp. 03-59-1]